MWRRLLRDQVRSVLLVNEIDLWLWFGFLLRLSRLFGFFKDYLIFICGFYGDLFLSRVLFGAFICGDKLPEIGHFSLRKVSDKKRMVFKEFGSLSILNLPYLRGLVVLLNMLREKFIKAHRKAWWRKNHSGSIQCRWMESFIALSESEFHELAGRNFTVQQPEIDVSVVNL